MTKNNVSFKIKRKEQKKRRKQIGILKKAKRKMWKRRKMNRLNLFKRRSNKQVIQYQFYSKSRSFSAIFSNVTFKHVNFKGSIMTSCSFKNSGFIGVEFWGANFRHSNFTGASFKHCVFVGSLLKDTNFRNTTFENCIFVNTNLENIKNFNPTQEGVEILVKYPDFNLSESLIKTVENLRNNEHILKYKILHLTTKKLNKLNLYLLLKKFDEETLIKGLQYSAINVKKDMPTISCLFNYLLKERNEYVIV
jgi:hypothetical protein